jgi:hypothetical protein
MAGNGGNATANVSGKATSGAGGSAIAGNGGNGAAGGVAWGGAIFNSAIPLVKTTECSAALPLALVI